MTGTTSTPKQTPSQGEQAEMPADDDLHGFVDGKFIPVSVVDGKIVPRDRPPYVIDRDSRSMRRDSGLMPIIG